MTYEVIVKKIIMKEEEGVIKIHQLKIEFNVMEQIKRFVYVYIIEAKYYYMIVSGVFGCEKQIISFLESIGRNVEDIKGIFLTHSHPDHIGSAHWFQKHIGCKIYASEGEKNWIENINLQFRERPIPNFYNLAGKSTRIDVTVKDGDIIKLENHFEIRVLRTAGHSFDDMSYCIENVMFIGDAVPVKGDIPIFINKKETRRTLDIINEMPKVKTFYPAWDQTYSRVLLKQKIQEPKEIINLLKATVISEDNGMEITEIVDLICKRLKIEKLKENLLFSKTIDSLRERGGV